MMLFIEGGGELYVLFVVVVTIWYLGLQLPVQSVPITT